MEINIRFRWPGKRFWVSVLAAAAAAALIFAILNLSKKNPIPESVTKQASFKSVYPSDIGLVRDGKSGFKYQTQQKTISFSATYQNVPLYITEQKAPANLVSGTSVYFSALGLHPVAQFDTKIGPVAIVNFYQNATLEPIGQSGILVAGNTMVIANATQVKKKLTNEQWKNFFDSLKQAK